MDSQERQVELERTVLGILLSDPSAFDVAAAGGIVEATFEVPRHQMIFKGVSECSEKGLVIDIASVSSRLPSGELSMYLVELMEKAPVSQNASYYVRELSAAAWRRRASIELAGITRRLATAANADQMGAVQAEAEAMLVAIAKGAPADTATPSPEQLVRRFEEQMDKRITDHRAGRQRGIRTGIKALDVHLGGWVPGSFDILGARTALGKTTLAVNFLQAAIADGKWAAFFTNEMADYDILGKVISRRTKIYGSRIYTGDLTDPQVEYIGRTLAEIERETLAINWLAGRRWETFSAECRRLRRAGKLDIVFQDYIQQMRWPSRRWSSRNEELTEISAGMKDLAIELNIPIIALAQLNRNAEKSGEKGAPPSVADLKDCGGLEQDADAIILIHRPRDDQDGTGNYLIVAKNRFGRAGQFKVDANMAENRFSDENYNREEG